jgi:hypothetical protein
MLAITMRIIATLLLAVVFWIVNVVGSVKRPFHMIQGANMQTAFLWDGILCMFLVCGLILAVAAFFNCLRTVALLSSIALVLAATAGGLGGHDSAFWGF